MPLRYIDQYLTLKQALSLSVPYCADILDQEKMQPGLVLLLTKLNKFCEVLRALSGLEDDYKRKLGIFTISISTLY